MDPHTSHWRPLYLHEMKEYTERVSHKLTRVVPMANAVLPIARTCQGIHKILEFFSKEKH